MESIVLSAFLQALFEITFKLVLEELELEADVGKQLKSCRRTLTLIHALLKDAGERQQTESAVKLWLDDIRDVAYNLNDLLDECSFEAERHRIIRLPKLRNSLGHFSTKRISFRHDIAHRMKGINEDLEKLIQQQNLQLGLIPHHVQTNQDLDNDQTSSFAPSSVIGRDKDKLEIVQVLVSSSPVAAGVGSTEVSVIPVLGMSGIGKTTVAQLAFNENIVENYFDLKLWAHVSRNLIAGKIMKSIIESIDGSAFNLPSLDGLERNLRSRLSGRKYLLVIDNVLNVDPHEWEKLRGPLLSGEKGSKILMTTRSEEVARIIGTRPPYYLRGLKDDDCWYLFCKHVLGPNQYQGSDVSSIRDEIIRKCKGLPLAVEAIGFRLRREADRSKWGAILQSEMWEFSGEDNDVLRSVRLSYQHLPPHLKPCFSYCSVFPKDSLYEKEVLIQLWMSQNFIHASGTERIEDAGERYFDSLEKLSFFQFSHFDYKSNRRKYKMHDLIHDFAQHVSGECCILEIRKTCDFRERARHCSVVDTPFSPMGSRARRASSSRQCTFETVYVCKGLYSLLAPDGVLPNSTIPSDLSVKLKRLRTLDLSNSGIVEVPDSIGELKHLRYLQLGNNKFRNLPNSLGGLYNLQTLGLGNCYQLVKLPADTKYLRNLRHLDLHLDEHSVISSHRSSTGSLRAMPPKMGKLINLQTLSRFVVGTESRSGLGELKGLDDLVGELCISKLEHVMNTTEPKDPKLAQKEYLDRLDLWWSVDKNIRFEGFDHEVLRLLEPHTNLKELKIVGFRGSSFPPWIGDPSFNHLKTLVLSDCQRITSLPPLGQLPSLKSLYIMGMDGVQLVDCKFCGSGAHNFRALEKLHFESMRRLQVWCGDENCSIPSLHELVIKDCRDLRQLTHNFPVLTKLVIEGSPWLMGLPKIPSLRSIHVKGGEWIWDSLRCLSLLTALTVTQLPTVTMTQLPEPIHQTLRRLEISHCDQLVSLPDGWLPQSLNYLEIRHCSKLGALPELMRLADLENLEIGDCPLVLSLPINGLPKVLQFFSIDNCPELSRRCSDERGEDWHMVEHVDFVWIDKHPIISRHKGQSSGVKH